MTPFIDIVDFVDKLILLMFLNVSLEMGKMGHSLLLIVTNDMFRYCAGKTSGHPFYIDIDQKHTFLILFIYGTYLHKRSRSDSVYR